MISNVCPWFTVATIVAVSVGLAYKSPLAAATVSERRWFVTFSSKTCSICSAATFGVGGVCGVGVTTGAGIVGVVVAVAVGFAPVSNVLVATEFGSAGVIATRGVGAIAGVLLVLAAPASRDVVAMAAGAAV